MTNPESLSLRRRLALEIGRKLYQQKVKEHPLRQLFWECTLRCNLHWQSDRSCTEWYIDLYWQCSVSVLEQLQLCFTDTGRYNIRYQCRHLYSYVHAEGQLQVV